MREIVVGSRDSQLAMWQTKWVVDQLRELYPTGRFRIVPIKTTGDKILDVALARIGDKGLFTKELEIALLKGEIDLAVHSLKDLPTELPAGCQIGAICCRADPRDVLISPTGLTLRQLPLGARIGTSSQRRRAQLLNYRPDLEILDLRGNLNTRLEKLTRQSLDAIVLAAAGVERLGITERISEYLPFEVCLPAVGQGAIAVEIRQNDPEIGAVVTLLNHFESVIAVTAERALLKRLGGGCQIPIAAYGEVTGESLKLRALVASVDGRQVIRGQKQGAVSEAVRLGEQLAEELLGQGADAILKSLEREIRND
ncbi:MAG: hydroxymethylbilane synthase [Firmicutes bacterium]|nr:hydroxymethylbilane synthase [Bacillota bacterium]